MPSLVDGNYSRVRLSGMVLGSNANGGGRQIVVTNAGYRNA